jgi:hypothetical protein
MLQHGFQLPHQEKPVLTLLDPETLRRLIEEEHVQQWKAAELLGVSVSCVERTCKRLGLKTQSTGPRRGPKHPDWKGGRYQVGRYWYVWAPEHPNATKAGYVAEHRLAMSQSLGRPLAPGEVVHHIDGNPENNELSNLMVFAKNSEHLRHELTGRSPNHTPEGRARMRESILRTHSRRRLERGG